MQAMHKHHKYGKLDWSIWFFIFFLWWDNWLYWLSGVQSLVYPLPKYESVLLHLGGEWTDSSVVYRCDNMLFESVKGASLTGHVQTFALKAQQLEEKKQRDFSLKRGLGCIQECKCSTYVHKCIQQAMMYCRYCIQLQMYKPGCFGCS